MVPGLGKIIMAPCTVARVQSLWACHQRVPSSVENITSWVKLVLGGMGHCVMFSGPSDQGFLGCLTPCLCNYQRILFHIKLQSTDDLIQCDKKYFIGLFIL